MALSGVTSGWDVSLCKYQPAQIVTSANINTNRKMCNQCNLKYQPAQIITSANINTNRKMCNKCNLKQAGIADPCHSSLQCIISSLIFIKKFGKILR